MNSELQILRNNKLNLLNYYLKQAKDEATKDVIRENILNTKFVFSLKQAIERRGQIESKSELLENEIKGIIEELKKMIEWEE